MPTKRRGVTWAATGIPEIRRQWCNALPATVDRFSAALDIPTDVTDPAADKVLAQMRAKIAASQVKLAADLEHMGTVI